MNKLNDATVNIMNTEIRSINSNGNFAIFTGYYDGNTGEEGSANNYARTDKYTSLGGLNIYVSVGAGYEWSPRFWNGDTFDSEISFGWHESDWIIIKPNYRIGFNIRRVGQHTTIDRDARLEISASFSIKTLFKLQDFLCNPFDPLSTYNIGDYVLYGRNVFRCVQPISEPGPWYRPNWTQISVFDEFVTSRYAIVGGSKSFSKNDVNSMPQIYIGKQLKIDIGNTLEGVKKWNNTNVSNVSINIPPNTDSVTYITYSSDTGYGSLFLDENGMVVGGYSGHTPAELVTVNIPDRAKTFIYSYATIYEDYYVIFTGNGIDKIDTGIGLHTIPNNVGVLNAIKRARQITDIKWSPAVDIPRTSILEGSHNQYFEDVFIAGKEYQGIPYSDFLTEYSHFVGISVPFDVFATSVCNSETAEALESEYSQYVASYYGSSCTGLTAYAMDMPYTYSSYYGNIEGMRLKFKLISNGVRHTLKDLSLGDIIQTNGHCALVTDLIYSDTQEVEYVEVSEQTRAGNLNKDIQGSDFGGKARRVTMTPDEFYSYYSEYNILSYDYIDKVVYYPSKYSPMQNEGKRTHMPNFPVLPYYGNKCCMAGGASCKLVIASTNYTHLIVKKDGVAWNQDGTSDPYNITGLTEITILCDADEAVYTASLATFSDSNIQYQTVECEWYIYGNVIVSAVYRDSSVNFTIKTEKQEFYPWFANPNGVHTVNGNWKKILDYEYEYTGGYHIYTFSLSVQSTPTKYILGIKSNTYGAIYITGNVTNN